MEQPTWDPLGYDLVGETKYLRIWTDEEVTLCGGDVRALDEQIEIGAGILDIPVDEIGTIDILLTSSYAVLESEGCSPYRSCYRPSLDVVLTTHTALRHELNHAVMARRAAPTPFVSEGFAEALSSLEESDLSIEVVDQFFTGSEEYINSRTFVQWLLTFHGHDRFRSFIDALELHLEAGYARPVERALEDAYGWTPSELIEQMSETMPQSFLTPYGMHCAADVVHAQTDPLPYWGFTVELECGNAQTYGIWAYSERDQPDVGPDAMTAVNTLTRKYTLELPVEGTYRISTEAPLAVIRPCVSRWDAPSSASPTWWGPLRYTPTGHALQYNHDEFFVRSPGTVTLEVGGAVDGPSSYEVSVVVVSVGDP